MRYQFKYRTARLEKVWGSKLQEYHRTHPGVLEHLCHPFPQDVYEATCALLMEQLRSRARFRLWHPGIRQLKFSSAGTDMLATLHGDMVLIRRATGGPVTYRASRTTPLD